MTKLVINCDDFGMSEGINYAVLTGFKKNFISSTTMMVNKEFIKEAMEIYHNYPINVGIHYTMTTGKSLGKHQYITDKDGNFHNQFYYINRSDFQFTQEELEEIKVEWDLQIQKGLELGLNITHLDGHHHTYMHSEEGREISFAMARKYNLPLRIDPRYYNMSTLPSDIRHVEHFVWDFDSIAHEIYQHKDQARALLEPVIEEISKHASAEIMCHPALLDDYLITHTSMNTQRLETLYVLQSDLFQELLTKYNITLVGYQDI